MLHPVLRFFPVFLLLIIFCSPVFSQQSAPNIVYIIADDIGWNDLGCYGNDVVKTPNIDKLAAGGIKFTNAYLTASSCSPSRNSIITGRYPHNMGAPELHMPLPEDQVPFPLLLKEAGYYTVQAGKFHFGNSVKRAFDQAYELKEAGSGGEERWVKCLQECPKEKPFFAWFAAMDAHRPWQADDFMITHNPADILVPPYLVDAPATRQDLASYYNEIARFDHYVGKVVEELDRQDILGNTLIMVMSDNGRPFPGSKTRVYDRGMKTPLIVHWPARIAQPAVCHSLVSAIDIAPTCLAAASVGIIPAIMGESFLPLLDDPQREFRQYIFAEHNWHDYEAHERMVRTKRHLFLVNARPLADQRGPADSNRSPSFQDLQEQRDKGMLTAAQSDIFISPRPRTELYDHIHDPRQLVNVAALPQYAEVQRELEQVLMRWMKETKDEVPRQITPDWYEKETGGAIEGLEQKRGNTPGGATGATEVTKEALSIF
jgi:arylsulfatase A-like enzyme